MPFVWSVLSWFTLVSWRKLSTVSVFSINPDMCFCWYIPALFHSVSCSNYHSVCDSAILVKIQEEQKTMSMVDDHFLFIVPQTSVHRANNTTDIWVIFSTKPASMLQFTATVFCVIILPVLAGNICRMPGEKLVDFVELIDEQSKVIDAQTKVIKDSRDTTEALEEQIVNLNQTMAELNRTNQEMEAQLNLIMPNIPNLYKKGESEYLPSHMVDCVLKLNGDDSLSCADFNWTCVIHVSSTPPTKFICQMQDTTLHLGREHTRALPMTLWVWQSMPWMATLTLIGWLEAVLVQEGQRNLGLWWILKRRQQWRGWLLSTEIGVVSSQNYLCVLYSHVLLLSS